MILTTLADSAAMHVLHPRFAAACAWLQSTDLTALAVGKHVIDGDNLCAIIEDGIGHDPAVRRFESHLKYIDIQLNVSGGETMLVTATPGLQVEDDFAPDGDIAFYHFPESRPVTTIAVLPGELAVFFPNDAHMPSLRLGSQAQTYRKVIVKVAIR